jgi:hypothetical protein
MEKENMVCITMGFYSAIEKNEFMSFAGKMDGTVDHHVK